MATGLFPPGWVFLPLQDGEWQADQVETTSGRPRCAHHPWVRLSCSLGLEVGALLLDSSFSLTACCRLGSLSHLKAWSTRASPREYTTLFFQKLNLAHILGCRFCVLLYKHLDDIAREGVDFEQIEPSYLFQKKTYFIIIRWLKNWK